MHEASIVQQVLETAESEMAKAGGTRILRVRLRVGVMAGVVPEALTFAFEALRTGTPADGASLEIESCPARFSCAACGKVEWLLKADFACPACGGLLCIESGGTELELSQLEVT